MVLHTRRQCLCGERSNQVLPCVKTNIRSEKRSYQGRKQRSSRLARPLASFQSPVHHEQIHASRQLQPFELPSSSASPPCRRPTDENLDGAASRPAGLLRVQITRTRSRAINARIASRLRVVVEVWRGGGSSEIVGRVSEERGGCWTSCAACALLELSLYRLAQDRPLRVAPLLGTTGRARVALLRRTLHLIRRDAHLDLPPPDGLAHRRTRLAAP